MRVWTVIIFVAQEPFYLEAELFSLFLVMLSSIRWHVLLWRKWFKNGWLFFITKLMGENVCVLILEYMDVVRNRTVRLFNDLSLRILRGLTQFNFDIFNVKVFQQHLKLILLFEAFEILVVGCLRCRINRLIVALLKRISVAWKSGRIFAMILNFVIDGGNYWLLINVIAEFRFWWIIHGVLLLDYLRWLWWQIWFFRTHVRQRRCNLDVHFCAVFCRLDNFWCFNGYIFLLFSVVFGLISYGSGATSFGQFVISMSEQATIAVFTLSLFAEVFATFVLLSDNYRGWRSRCRRYVRSWTGCANNWRRLWFRKNLYWWCLLLGLFRLWLDLLHDVFALLRIVWLLLMVIGLLMVHYTSSLTPVISVATILIILLLIAVKVIWCDWVYVKLGHIEISYLSIWRAAWMGGIGVLVVKVGEGIEVCSRREMAVIRHICD